MSEQSSNPAKAATTTGETIIAMIGGVFTRVGSLMEAADEKARQNAEQK
ncbi:MAG: hypothetical protein WC675_00665 [Patescibacteria group bacterium]|jgi:hypothetical protein